MEAYGFDSMAKVLDMIATTRHEAATCIGLPPDYDKCPGLSPAVLCGECVKVKVEKAVGGLHAVGCLCGPLDDRCILARAEAMKGAT